MSVVTVSMPGELLAEIDAIVEAHDYSGRSEVVRNASRSLVAEFRQRELADKQLACVVTVLYPYNSSDIEADLHDLRHKHTELIGSNTHNCLGGDQGCLETFVVECDLEMLSTFVRDLEATGEAVEVDYAVYPVDEIGETVLFSS
ncbi:MAG: CopG family ribbon-helix-helix protein [Halohasta sp.]